MKGRGQVGDADVDARIAKGILTRHFSLKLFN
jgi:hypothetical protein